MYKYLLSGLLFILFSLQPVFGQQDNVNPLDYGMMWTFEHPPVKHFENKYGFKPTQEWLDRVRMASLRFANFCSSSFISPDGLILTNHHCSRGSVGDIMKDGEDFDKTGFYAKKQGDERRVEGLYVKQLVKIKDITEEVKAKSKDAKDEAELQQIEQAAVNTLVESYSNMPEWKGLEVEPVTYYSGGKYSLYGYKRFDDIRLVLIPELALGYYGGDADNFTYPRYTLDFTLWRAYDENGEPVNSSDYYFRFNAEGAKENEPVFVTGNPGSTERYRTMAQLEYDRDYRYKIQQELMTSAYGIMEMQYEDEPSHDLQETMFSLANSMKARKGIIEGLNDERLMSRKRAMEEHIRSKAVEAGTKDYWAEIEKSYEPLKAESNEITLLAPNGQSGFTPVMAYLVNQYEQSMQAGASEEDLQALRDQLTSFSSEMASKYEKIHLTNWLRLLKKYQGMGDGYVDDILDGRSPETAAEEILKKTVFTDSTKLAKLLANEKKMEKGKDPIMQISELVSPRYMQAVMAFRASSPMRRGLEQRVSNEAFKLYDINIPPDATFTLRIADGTVKGYEYNGTKAPWMTTYFGLYNRHYAHQMKAPWNLPKRWENPPMGLLKSPLNFVSTNDIIGGNSGSPIINQKGELVGLVFDGNIESLPGNFIYDSRVNRTISVHAGGISAAMRYIFKADRILKELELDD